MAKKRKKRRNRRTKQRDTRAISKFGKLLFQDRIWRRNERYRKKRSVRPSENLISDERRWNPTRHHAGLLASGVPGNVTIRPPRTKMAKGRSRYEKSYFTAPIGQMACQRRRRRRETLFRRNKIGKGKSVSRIRLRNQNTEVRCK